MIGEWLSAATVTTLLGPKIGVVEMSLLQQKKRDDGSDNIGDRVSASSPAFSIRVEAFGSGAVIVPCFPVYVKSTTIGDLHDCVRQYSTALNDDDEEHKLLAGFNLLWGEQELNAYGQLEPLTNIIDVETKAGSNIVIVGAVIVTKQQVERASELRFLRLFFFVFLFVSNLW